MPKEIVVQPAPTTAAPEPMNRSALVAGWLACPDDAARRAYVAAHPEIVTIYSEARNFAP